MADQEHLQVLIKGDVRGWNRWRAANKEKHRALAKARLYEEMEKFWPHLDEFDLRRSKNARMAHRWYYWREVDLSGADLKDLNLCGANLSRANLSRADLSGAGLTKANLKEAELRQTNLRNAFADGANFSGANLTEAIVDGTVFEGANFSRAVLQNIDLNQGFLEGANLTEADLRGSNLYWAHLNNAKLAKAKLSGVNLSHANLIKADIRGADLTRADLSKAFCEGADFSKANLSATCLIDVRLNGATLTGTCLWECQRAGWSIKGTVCEYAYWDKERKERTILGPGELERLYSDKTRVRIFFKDGISPLEFSTLPALVSHLEKSLPQGSMRLESINDTSGGAVVTIAIEEVEDSSPIRLKKLKGQLEATAKKVIEYQRKVILERETRLQLEGEVKQLNSVVDRLIMRPSVILKNRGNTIVGDTYNIGQGIGGRNVQAHDATFNQIGGMIERSMDLSQLAVELSKLREAMNEEAQDSSQYVAIDEVAKAEEAAKAKDSSKVAESLKGAGKWALDVATKIGVSLATEAIKQSTGLQ